MDQWINEANEPLDNWINESLKANKDETIKMNYGARATEPETNEYAAIENRALDHGSWNQWTIVYIE